METIFSTPVVIDNGAYNIKSGLASENCPRDIFPPIIAHLEDEICIGSTAKHRNVVTKSVITEHVTNWHDMELVWEHCFKSLNIEEEDLTDHPLLLTQVLSNSKSEKEKMFEILFEKFNPPGIYLENQSILSLHSQGLLTGTVIHSGLHKSEVTPIYEGLAINPPNFRKSLNYAGSDITFNLMANLRKLGWHCDFDSVNSIKENLCYFAKSSNNEEDVSTKTYKLPDGEIVKIGKDLYEVPEQLFKPKNHWQGIHEILIKSIEKCDFSIREELSNIVLSGGNTLLKGFPDRLQSEIVNLNQSDFKILTPENRDISSWIGGTVIASLPNFRKMWISKKEYRKYGPKIVHMKCF